MNTKTRPDVDQIMQAIEDEVVAGRLLPGTRLDERVLSERFDVSRTPIREALLRLSLVGIVEMRRNKGTFITEPTSQRMLGMLEVLAELKVYAASLAARRMSVPERHALVALSDRMKVLADANDLKNYFALSNEVHAAIFQGTQNSYLIETARNIQSCMCAYRRHLSQAMHRPLLTSLEENRNIVGAIFRGDAVQAAHWMREQTELRREELSDLMLMLTHNATPLELEPA
jgi:DNA-binding GntR family transcriptional regulator